MKLMHSRISSPNQMKALPLKHGVCITFGEATRGTIALAEQRLRDGGAVMVDNGAYSLFKRGERLSMERAAQAVDLYERLAAVGGDLMVVAPDVIGDSHATSELQTQFAPRLRAMREAGVKVIVPVQGFDLSAAIGAWRSAVAAIGPDIVAGVPSHKAAWSDDMVREFHVETGCRRFHFLGGSRRARRDLAAELGVEASSDSGFAVIAASNKPGRMTNLWREAELAERRVAGVGVKFFTANGQQRWPWAWRG